MRRHHLLHEVHKCTNVLSGVLYLKDLPWPHPYLPQCDCSRQHVRLDARAEGPTVGHNQVLPSEQKGRFSVVSGISGISVMIVEGDDPSVMTRYCMRSVAERVGWMSTTVWNSGSAGPNNQGMRLMCS